MGLTSPGRRTILSFVVAAVLAVAGLVVLLNRPGGAAGPSPLGISLPATLPPDEASPSPAPRTSPADPSSCRVGTPRRIVIPALHVNAWFEQIGLDTSAKRDAAGKYPLGVPQDRTKAGWYSLGPRPGSGQGTVLTNGHTYRNNSAIFKEDFSKRIAPGQLIHLIQDNGSICSYAVSEVWREANAQRDYPRIVASEHLYDFTGPERLFLATCGGSWNAAAQNYDDISIVIATPVHR